MLDRVSIDAVRWPVMLPATTWEHPRAPPGVVEDKSLCLPAHGEVCGRPGAIELAPYRWAAVQELLVQATRAAQRASKLAIRRCPCGRVADGSPSRPSNLA